MKNILVLLHDDAGQEARFQAALDVTRAMGGHLNCVDVVAAPIYVGDFAMTGGEALLLADEQEREDRNRSRFKDRLEKEGVPFTWTDATGFLSPTVREAGGLNDLIVLNLNLKDQLSPDMYELTSEVVLKSGRPVLAVPVQAEGFDAFGPALVAWDGSAEADAALRAAVPLLQKARSVTILEVNDGSIRQPAEVAAQYLSRHDVKPIVKAVPAGENIPSTIILDTLEDLNASYLVMGGFGHSRFVEAAIGGVTRRMLRECPVPIFLAH